MEIPVSHELGTVRQTLMWLLEHGREAPTRTPSGRIKWKLLVYRSMHRMLTSPTYGGAYSKTEHLTGYEGSRAHPICRRKPKERWLALIPGAHEGYVTQEEFERIRKAVGGEQLRKAAARGCAKRSGPTGWSLAMPALWTYA
jgi:hypothetical protein